MPTPPRRRKTVLPHVTSRNKAQERLRALYALYQDWRRVGAEIGISGGTAYRVAMSDYEPQNAKARKALGLPVLGLGEICPVHGRVCAVKHKLPAAKGKPRRQWKKDYLRARDLLALALPYVNNPQTGGFVLGRQSLVARIKLELIR